MTVYFPASTDARSESEPEETVKSLPSGRGALVLLVDDEDSIRQITRSTLETFGYQVLAAADGTEERARMPEAVRASVEVFLTKPYTAEMLLTSLSQVLAN